MLEKIKIYELAPHLTKIIEKENQSYDLVAISESQWIHSEEFKIANESKPLQNSVPEDEENNTVDWLDNNKRLGDFGENIAMNYLVQSFPEYTVKHVADNAKLGYDIELIKNNDSLKFEVKTAKNHIGFHISLNEIQKAQQFGDKYNIFFIRVGEDKEFVNGYIIYNPLEQLEIDLAILYNQFENTKIHLYANKFFIKLTKSFLHTLEKIDLEKYIPTSN